MGLHFAANGRRGGERFCQRRDHHVDLGIAELRIGLGDQDEIGAVAAAIDRMLNRLQHAFDTLGCADAASNPSSLVTARPVASAISATESCNCVRQRSSFVANSFRSSGTPP